MLIINAFSLVGAIVGIITYFSYTKKESPNSKIVIYISFALIFVLSVGNGYLIYENQRFQEPITKVKQYLDQWEPRKISFISNGELKGAIIEGMIILESFKAEYPDNYSRAMALVYQGHDPRINENFWDEREKLEEGFEAVLNIVKGFYISNR